jgi:serine protease
MKKFVWSAFILFALALAACNTPPVPPPPPFNPQPDPPKSFSLTLQPNALKVGPANKVSATIQITRAGDFSDAIDLSLDNLPADVKAVFDPNPATGDTSTLKLVTDRTSLARVLDLNVKGVAGALQASSKASLEVTAALPAPTVALDATLVPSRPALSGINALEPRPLVTVRDAKGKRLDFTDNELIVVTDDQAALNAFLARYKGTVLRSKIPPTGIKGLKPVYHVKLNLETVDASLTASRLAQLEPGKTGNLQLSSVGAQRLLGVFAQERLNGLNVALNFTMTNHSFNDGVSQEASGDSSNAMEWSYFRRGGNLDIDVASAWKALERAGKLDNKVRIGIVDEGFTNGNYGWTSNPDMPTVKGTRGIMNCDGDCKHYHGHKVALAAAGLADNSYGAAGPAGPIGELVFSGTNLNDTAISEAYDILSDVPDAADMGAKIINMSFGAAIPAMVSATAIPIEDMTQTLRANGVLLFASAGNDGEDVDAEDCFAVCWEEAWHMPCENDGVICVGGMAANERARDPDSNYGFEAVRIWAPFTVSIGPSPDNQGNLRQSVRGTSFSSPFVAGVAALVWAANPSLSATQVWNRIRDNSVTFGNPPYLRRQVRAFKAVSAVLGNTVPYVNITAPANNASQEADTQNRVTFTAQSDDLEGGNCCSYTWSSDLDGNMGTGSPLEFDFAGKQGTRNITVTAKDSQGATSTDTIKYRILNVPPKAEIELPSANKTYFRNQQFLLRGKGTDYSPYPVTLPCSSLKWQITKPNNAIVSFSDCERTVNFDMVGELNIKLTATDSDGTTNSQEITVNLIERPAGAWVDITSPLTGTFFDQDTVITLNEDHFVGSATIVNFQWVISAPTLNKPNVSFTRVPGPTQLAVRWKPRDDYPVANCGSPIPISIKVTVNTNLGTVTDSVLIKITGSCVPN